MYPKGIGTHGYMDQKKWSGQAGITACLSFAKSAIGHKYNAYTANEHFPAVSRTFTIISKCVVRCNLHNHNGKLHEASRGAKPIELEAIAGSTKCLISVEIFTVANWFCVSWSMTHLNRMDFCWLLLAAFPVSNLVKHEIARQPIGCLAISCPKERHKPHGKRAEVRGSKGIHPLRYTGLYWI